MMAMDCGEDCDQVADPCRDMPCSAEHLCSGSSVFMVPLLVVTIKQGAGCVTPLQPEHYRYRSISLIDHPPQITV